AATIRGKISKAGTADPLQGVQITLVPLTADEPPIRGAFSQNVTFSDSAGSFYFRRVRGGTYAVETQYERSFCWPRQQSAIPLAAGESIEVSLAMTPGAVISGQVRDAFGQPMTNVNVDVLKVTYREGFPTLRAIAGQATDDRGEYRVFWVPPGEY